MNIHPTLAVLVMTVVYVYGLALWLSFDRTTAADKELRAEGGTPPKRPRLGPEIPSRCGQVLRGEIPAMDYGPRLPPEIEAALASAMHDRNVRNPDATSLAIISASVREVAERASVERRALS